MCSLLSIMHGCSRVTIDPRIPVYNAGTEEHVGFSPTRQTSLQHQARSAVRCSRRIVGFEGELHPTKNRLWGGLSCIWMTASNELSRVGYLIYSHVGSV